MFEWNFQLSASFTLPPPNSDIAWEGKADFATPEFYILEPQMLDSILESRFLIQYQNLDFLNKC
jgi:hypothetical protein